MEDEIELGHITIRKVFDENDTSIRINTSSGLSFFDAMGLVAVAQDSLAAMYEGMDSE